MKSAYFSFAATALLSLAASMPPSFGMTTERSTAQTAHYRLELDIGNSERMYSKAEMQRLKPTHGEIMVSGKMVGGMGSMGGMATATSVHHLELHVRSKASGKAVRDAKVSISVTGPSLKRPITVPIAVMYGIPEGKSDWHYGNNVNLAPGKYEVRVSANGEPAKFTITIPKT